MRTLSRFIVSSTLAAAAFAVQAQDAAPVAEPAADVGIAIAGDSGSVLVSTGGEFTRPAPGQTLAAGDRVLVSEGSSATLSYSDGCQKALVTAGVYTVEAECSLASTRGRPSPGVIAGVVGGVAVIAAAAGGGGGGGGSGPTPPISP